MEPRIQYARTKDGVNIAFWTLGEGRPLVFMPFWFSHAQLGWEIPELRRFYERMSEGRTFVTYDGRGMGLSDRDASDLSLEAYALDLEAVADRLELERFALFAVGIAAPVAIVHAAHHPERVTHLVLGSACARSSDIWGGSQSKAIEALRKGANWELYTETVAHYLFQWTEAEQAEKWAVYMRESITREADEAWRDQWENFDVSDVLPQITSPTLVLHPRQTPFLSVDSARYIASRIPNARLALVEGRALGMESVNFKAVTSAIDNFLAEGEEATAAAELPEGMAVLLFADIAESTALTEQLGDAAFRAKARELDTSLRSVIHESGGTPVEGKVLGDGVLAVFTSARQAIDCALRCEATGEPVELQLHLGIHAGDVIREGNNVYGGAVNIAARIAAASEPGEVLVSDIVRGLARTSAGVSFDDRGEQTLKGVGEPQRLFAVRGGG
jgi:class 3 adenylate cyclase